MELDLGVGLGFQGGGYASANWFSRLTLASPQLTVYVGVPRLIWSLGLGGSGRGVGVGVGVGLGFELDFGVGFGGHGLKEGTSGSHGFLDGVGFTGVGVGVGAGPGPSQDTHPDGVPKLIWSEGLGYSGATGGCVGLGALLSQLTKYELGVVPSQLTV